MSLWMITGACAILLAGITAYCFQKKKGRWRIGLPFFLFAGCFLAAGARETSGLENWLLEQGGEGRIAVTGTVFRIEEREEKLWLYVKGTISEDRTDKADGLLVIFPKGQESVLPGMKIEALGMLETFAEARNRGQFDYRAYYRALGIAGRMKADKIRVTDSRRWLLPSALTRLRTFLSENISSLCEERDAGILKAILLGERWEAPEEAKNLYQANGISHLLAISGLHISFLGMGLYRILRRLTGSYPLAGVLGVISVGSYGYMVGESPSALRACIMFAIMALGNGIGRTYDLLSAVSLSGLLLLCRFPLLYGQASFQLSVGAVFGIGLLTPVFYALLPAGGRAARAYLSTLSVSFLTLPILLYHYYEFPMQSLFLNLLVIPLAGILMGAGVLGVGIGCFFPEAGHFFLGTVHVILDLYEFLCGLGKGLSWNLVLGRPSSLRILLYVLFLTALYGALEKNRVRQKKRKRREKEPRAVSETWRRWLSKEAWFSKGAALSFVTGLFLISLLFFAPVSDGRLSISVLDVGQGDGILIRGTDQTAILVDGGSSTDRNLGKNLLIPFLKANGIRKLDYVILTHLDTDHVSGVRQLLEEGFLIEKLLLSRQAADSGGWKEWEVLLKKNRTEERIIGEGERISLGEASLTCLWPKEERKDLSDNNGSLVFSLTFRQFSMILTGDLEEKGEEELLSMGVLPSKITVLKAGHHGSSGSSSQAFLEHLSPAAVFVSCSADNPYGHPHKDAMDRFFQAGSKVFLTMERGELWIRTDGKRTTLSAFH